MRPLLTNAGLFIALLLSFSACDYFCDCEAPTTPCLFAYDRLIYTPNGEPNEQLATPTFESDQPAGTFSAQPGGLVIDSLSGAIDVNASAEGEYTVVYTLDDGKTTCETKVVIGKGDVQVKECIFSYEEGATGEPGYFIPIPFTTQLGRPTFKDDTPIEGTFTVEPQGLDLNPSTGVFDVNGSESGVVYTVTYTSKDKLTVCQTKVTIAGFDYKDTVIDVSVAEAIVFPTAARPEREPLGTAFVEQSEEPRLVFIDTDNVPGLSSETGAIDLKATLQTINALDFGGNAEQQAIPEDGYSREFTITYQYTEAEGNNELVTVSDLEIILYWFPDFESIPEELRDLVNYKAQFANGRTEKRPNHVVTYGKYQ